MGLLGNNEEKKSAKAEALLDRYGLQDLVDDRDYDSVKKISLDLMGNRLIELGTALQGNGADAAKMSYLHAIMEQNFIIIRQLDRIASNLEGKHGKR